jgi:hypothetical protein
MRHGLGCGAVNCIAAHQYKPIVSVIPTVLPDKDKRDVGTDLGLHSALEAIWTRGAGTFPFERS